MTHDPSKDKGSDLTLSEIVTVPDTLPHVKPSSKVYGNERLSKAGRTVRNLRPSGYGTLAF